MGTRKWRFYLAFLAALVLLLGAGMLGAQAEGEVPAGLSYYIMEDGVFISGYTGSETALLIPGTIEGKPVVSIEYGAFRDKKNLQGVVIPSGVTSIGGEAFFGCSALSSISIPSTVRYIGYSAFSGCTSLSKITLPAGVKKLESGIFSGCTNLSSINLSSVSSYEYGVFFGCSSLKSVSLAAGLTSIPDSLFQECSSLSSVSIPSTVTSIGDSAFSGCSGLSSLTIPSGVTSIGGYAFYRCSSISSLEVPKGLTSIENSTFYGCSSLSSIKIPSRVRSIGSEAFHDCDSLSTITVPSSVSSIGWFAFAYCDNLRTVTIPISVTSIGTELFGWDNYNKTIRGYPYSTAEKYAKDNNITFKALPIVQATSMTLSSQGFSLQTGKKQQLTAQVSPDNATYKAVTWTSSNPDVAMVTTDGQVMGVSAGQVTITAKAKDGSNVMATCPVAVLAAGTGMNLSPGASLVPVGGTQQIKAQAVEAGTTLPALKWTSSKETVAIVDQEGKVTGVAPGTAIITATAEDGSGMKATCGIRVQQLITTISLDPATFHLEPDASLTLAAQIEPENAANKALVWTSSNPEVATVSAKGTVKALMEGEATITASTQDGSKKKAESLLTVSRWITSIRLSKTALTLNTGDVHNLTATIQPTNATDKTLKWNSSDDTVAQVDDHGQITAKGPGSATITAAAQDGSEEGASCEVTVLQKVAEIKLSSQADSLDTTQTLQISAEVLPEDASDKTLTWTSSDKGFATVDQEGKVTGVAPGQVTITATAKDGNGAFGVKELLVIQKITKLVLADLTLEVGEEKVLPVTIQPDNASNKTLTWTSSPSEIAKVDEVGKITALKPGTATVTVAAQDGSGESTSCKVTVIQKVAEILIKSEETSLITKKTLQLSASVLPENATNRSLTWSSSNEAVATVNQDGLVSGVVPGGKATITATAKDGSGVKASIQLTVIRDPFVAPLKANIHGLSYSYTNVFGNVTAAISFNIGATGGLSPYKFAVSVTKDGYEMYSNPDATGGEVSLRFDRMAVGLFQIHLTVTDKEGFTAKAKMEINHDGSAGITVVSEVKPATESALKGDANNNGKLDIKDIESMIDYLVNGKACPSMKNADTDGNKKVDLADLIWLVNQLAK